MMMHQGPPKVVMLVHMWRYMGARWWRCPKKAVCGASGKGGMGKPRGGGNTFLSDPS